MLESLPVNVTDLAVFVVLLLSAALAFVRGFVHEVLALAAWLGAALATLYALPYVQPYAREVIAIPLIADIVGGVAVFLVALVALSILGRLLARLVQRAGLGPLDRSLGLLFGVLRGVLVVSVAWLLMSWTLPRPDERPAWIAEAKTGPLLHWGAFQVTRVLPEDLRREGMQALGDLEDGAAARGLELLPAPKDGAPAQRSGYKDAERKDLERLIESTQSSGSGSGGE